MTQAGPFGLWMGMKLEDISAQAEEVAPFKYRISTPPKPHSAFDAYVVQIAPVSGLSWIKAIGRTVSTSSFGTDLEGKFDEMEQKLIKSYGPCTRTDALMPGSIWNEPRDWMTGLMKKERYLFCTWDQKSGAFLQNGLKAVVLGATALDDESGYVSVEYSFDNDSESDSEISSLEDDAL